MSALVGDDYRLFLEGKVKLASYAGFTVDPADINPALLGHQAALVRWAAAGGRRAVFASFGLGKSVIQAELMRLCREHVARTRPERLAASLIVAPYGAGWEIEKDAREILGLPIRYIRNTWEAFESRDLLDQLRVRARGAGRPGPFLRRVARRGGRAALVRLGDLPELPAAVRGRCPSGSWPRPRPRPTATRS
jgi:hypothetical protein